MVVEKVDSVVRADFREVLVSAAIQMHSIPLNYPTPIYSVLVAALALDPVVRATPDLFSLGQVGQANPVHRALALRVCILSHRNIASNMYPAVRWQMHSNFR